MAFFGEVLLALGRWLRGRSAMRGADVLQQLDLTGPRSLPIVLLSCALIGLMLAYMGGAQLGRIGAQNFLADVVTVGMVRELAGMMTGIILAGRVGSAFAAQLATMKAGEEIDALRVLGVDPISHLVLPRLLALMGVAPVLITFGAVAGVLAGWPAAVGAYGVTTAEYFNQCLRALSFTHLWIGLFKGMLYVALRNRGVDKIAVQADLEGGTYDLALAERFGPLDAEAKNWRDWAELYIRGASFWDVDWSQAVYYFSQLAPTAPNLRDASGWTATDRYLQALLGYGNWLSAAGDHCLAAEQYHTYLGLLADPQVEPTVVYADEQCGQGDQGDQGDEEATPTPEGESTPQPTDTPTP